MQPFEHLFGRIKEILSRHESRSLSNTKPHYINDTTLRSDIEGYAIQAINSDVTFTTLEVRNEESESNGLVNMTLPAGQIVYLNIKDIELAGGDAIVYER